VRRTARADSVVCFVCLAAFLDLQLNHLQVSGPHDERSSKTAWHYSSSLNARWCGCSVNMLDLVELL
jgi:hypothetical protein